MKKSILQVLFLLCFTECNAQVILEDVFTRNLSGHAITLVDWEGYMANPAIRLTATPPPTATFPFTLSLSANHARLYFDTPSSAGSTGPSKTLTFTHAGPLGFYISIFPDRQGGDENYTLTLTSSYGSQAFPIQVIDQDSTSPVINYSLVVNYSPDKAPYNFFSNQTHRNIVQQAADDWAFYIQNMNFDQVPAAAEQTWIWNNNFNGGNYAANTNPYTGFLLYTYGFIDSVYRSGGAPSNYAFQKINGVATNLRRSAGFDVEVRGNYNTIGWDTSIVDNSWYVATNFGNVQNDLYSICMHEMGHALAFNPDYPVFKTYKKQGYVNDSAVVAYQGTTVPVAYGLHLSNFLNDFQDVKTLMNTSLRF